MKLSKNSDVAEAMDYMLKAWPAYIAFLDDGRIRISNNAVERALRGIALGRKSWLLAGSGRSAQHDLTAKRLLTVLYCIWVDSTEFEWGKPVAT